MHTGKVIHYYAAVIEAKSPLKLASGKAEFTDSDVLLDPGNKPFIPGTTVAGACRHFLEEDMKNAEENKGLVKKWFGYQSPNADEGQRSRFIFYDANLIGANAQIMQRDGIRLEDRIAVAKAKYDYEIVDKGCRFLVRLEVTLNEGEDSPPLINALLAAINNGDIRFGGKISRGFGRMSVVEAYKRTIDLTQDIEAFIGFSWNDYQGWSSYIGWGEESPSVCYRSITRSFTIPSFLAIRDYLTLDDGNAFESLTGSDGKAVIPGTSWAGAFRRHIGRLLDKAVPPQDGKAFTDAAFGPHEEDGGEPRRSNILFEETVLEGPDQGFLTRTRVAIDRLTGGSPGDGKLFTYQTAYGQTGELVIRIRNDFEQAELAYQLVNLCLDELDAGLLTIGGLAAIGGGICKVDEGEAGSNG
jgi:CRISPR/Cas system CSM-associated protein Csm3 (group 7 of RAMP superfamily)